MFCIVEWDRLMEILCPLCKVLGKGSWFVKGHLSPVAVWLINSVSLLVCPTVVLVQYEAASHMVFTANKENEIPIISGSV